MAEVRAALVGACGKMGQMIVRRINSSEGMKISAAFDLVNVGKVDSIMIADDELCHILNVL